MRIYNADTSNYSEKQRHVVAESATAAGLAKVYLWFGLGILLTGAMCIGWPYLMLAVSGHDADTFSSAYMISLIVFLVLLIPLGVAVSFSGLSKHSAVIKTFYILYSICMGGALSTITLAFDYDLLLYAFIVTALSFLLMAGIGYWTKGKVGRALPFLLAFIFGMMLISLFNFLLLPLLPTYNASQTVVYWITSVLILAVYMILAAVDTNRVLRIAQAKGFENGDTLAVYCAYELYADFVIIFIYILRFLSIFAGSRRSK